jgi:predicted dehydrogenase
MLKVAIIGCGKIADSHASQIQRIPDCEIVGVCDNEELMAKQLCERFRTKLYFSDLTRLLSDARPDVVHITSPPETHFVIAKQCLDWGCHAYVEKPFTLDTPQAQTLIQLAQEKGLKVTVGHDDQFRPSARRLRQLIQDGYLGGPPVHMESYYCYEFLSNTYARSLLADTQHWVRRLPGGLLQNIISHGIARIAEFLPGDMPHVVAHGFVSPPLRNLGETGLLDELRVLIRAGSQTTAYFTFSSQLRPSLHQFRIFGPKNGLFLDQDNETLLTLRGKRYKSYLEQFVPPVTFASQYLHNSLRNVMQFLASDFHSKNGMRHLIGSFYSSIAGNSALPIPYREILLTARIMDEIFSQLNHASLHTAVASCPS